MCQVCGIKEIASRERWPKPLEAPIKDLEFLVTTAHEDYENNKAQCARKDTIPASLLDVLRMIATSLDELEKDRETWWTTPEKRQMRKRLEAEFNQEKLTNLHRVNNATSERIEAMDARLGTFVRWSLGMNGGVWELKHGERVQAGEQVKAEAVS